MYIGEVSKSYKNKAIFKNCSFEMIERGFVWIKGKSGEGKTTFINCLSGLDNFDCGKIKYANVDYQNLKDFSSFVYQDFQLIGDYTVYENLKLASPLAKEKEINEIATRLKITKILEQLGYNISAGQKQRVSIARAILQKRDIIILDEPLSNIDEKNREIILNYLIEIAKQKLVIVVSHEEIDENICDQIIEFCNGRINSKIRNNNTSILNEKNKNKLTLKDKLKLVKGMIHRTKRIFISFFVSIITFSCFFSFASYSMIDENEYYSNMYHSNENSYISFFGGENTFFKSLNYEINNNLDGICYDYELARHAPTMYLSYENNVAVVKKLIHAKSNEIKIKSKTYELDNDEILISNDIAKCIEIKSGDNLDFYISTITAEMNENYTLKVKYIDENDDFVSTIVCGNDTYNDLLDYSTNKKYSNTMVNFGVGDLLTYFFDYNDYDETLLCGNCGTEYNEIVISSTMANRILDDNESFNDLINKEITFSYYLKSTNIICEKNHIDEKYIITGIFDTTGYDSAYIVFGNSELIKEIKLNYFETSLNQLLNGYILFDYSSNDFIKVKKNNWIVNGKNKYNIEGSYSKIITYRKISFALSIVLLAISFLFLYLYVRTLFIKNHKTFGILLTLGYSKQMITSCISLAVSFIVLLSFVISILSGYGLVIGMNAILLNMFHLNGTIVGFKFISALLGLCLAFAQILVIYLVSIIYFKRKNSIEIIYGKEK